MTNQEIEMMFKINDFIDSVHINSEILSGVKRDEAIGLVSNFDVENVSALSDMELQKHIIQAFFAYDRKFRNERDNTELTVGEYLTACKADVKRMTEMKVGVIA